ncbi:MAG: CDP-glycerol glycerophosphotransferase family protein [Lachnospiraceae bacterium]|nr:CDP-glycerol glycerophosphotransferase family protein [Lachnospiraceae bacterium]
MDLSLIWICTDNKEHNKKTLDFLLGESDIKGLEVLCYGADGEFKKELNSLSDKVQLSVVDGFHHDKKTEIYKDAKKRITKKWMTELIGGDSLSSGTFKEVEAQIKKNSDQIVVMVEKLNPEGEVGAFSTEITTKKVLVEKLGEKYFCYPYYLPGTFVKAEEFKNYDFKDDIGVDADRLFMLDVCAKKKTVLFVRSKRYFTETAYEGDKVFYKGIYDPDHYLPAMKNTWIPYLSGMKAEKGTIPEFIQYHFMFVLNSQFIANQNNKNKHAIPEGEEIEYLKAVGEALQFIDDKIMNNSHKVPECIMPDSLKWVMGIFKYGEDYKLTEGYLSGKPYYGAGSTLFNTIANLKTNILFMDYRNGYLEIDGTVHPLLYSMADEVFFTFAGIKYSLDYNGRYSINKSFGVSLYKAHSFHVSIPIENKKEGMLFCFSKFDNEAIKITFSFESHFSRMSGRFKESYWSFGKEKRYLMTKVEDGFKIKNVGRKEIVKQERKLQWEMFKSLEKKAWLFIFIRNACFVARPFMKRRPIWMYLDKIYKGGDSSEYLYKYASKQNNNFKHYYLVDKKASDYKRLKKEGYKPLVRGTIKHRLVFLLSDMMVISNSTVYAFNNFGMINSSYIRDIPDFHVVCVQHGMSVQKIAVAQNRLRDNTRLYFCASKYEFKNLRRPVYDYVGYNALKLTGVPRYDGLVNDDKKQIMISPTWRMQAAVPVRGSEGEQRGYNPLFKDSMYYKVFNALINDKRLIDAAKKYGYKIKYVLHPIVSSQVEDFDKNDYVDIIPAVGDMSYERMFCESSLMVTDFSGIQFDFAYMRKPLVYLHHKDIPQHYEEGSFFYDTMAFGEIAHDNDELIDLLTEYMANGCKMKEEYVRRADDFFYFDDHNNCERIYNEMVKYQNRYILGKECYEKLQDEFDIGVRNAMLPKVDKLIADMGVEKDGQTISDDYFTKPINEKAVVLLGLGKNVRGSTQYILNELNHSPEFAGFKIFVRSSEETEDIIRGYIEKNNWTRTFPITANNEYSKIMETSKYMLTETYFPEAWVKRPEQVYINIWHGTPLKKLGLAKNSKNVHKDGNTQRNFIEADYLLYPNEYTRDNMLASYKVAGLMRGKVLMLGYPRTGGMLEALNRDLSEVKKVLSPNGEKVYAYMPTWKDYLKLDPLIAETKEFLQFLDDNLRDDQILYVNLHHKVNDVVDYAIYKHIKKFPPDVDSYELLAASDALITDYSSVFYDYLATRKQIVLYCEDYELYRKKRGTYMDLMSLPFDKARTKEEVIEALNRGKTYDDTEAYNTFCGFDSVENAKKLVSLFIDDHDDKKVEIQDIQKDDRRKALIYSESFEKSEMTDVLYEVSKNYDRKKSQIYYSCEMFSVDPNKKSAYPLLKEDPVIGTLEEAHLTGRGKTLLKLYKGKKIGFDKLIEYIQYDYALHTYRMYGRAKFDNVLIYDVMDPGRIIALSTMNAKRYLFITGRMLDAIEGEDEFLSMYLKDATKYAAKRAAKIYVFSEEDKKRVSSLISSEIKIDGVATASIIEEIL